MATKVLVIGSGLAGLTAAYTALLGGAEVTLLDRGTIGLGNNSTLSAGGFFAPSQQCRPADYIAGTLQTGKEINSRPMVELVAREAPGVFERLTSLGLNLELKGTQYLYQAARQDRLRGAQMMAALKQNLSAHPSLQRQPHFQVTEILLSNQVFKGVRGWNRQGERIELEADAAVLATGGAAGIYQHHDNQKSTLGQGYYLAARAGLPLWDMEFVQFYPLVLAQPGLPTMMIYPPFPPEAGLLNAEGEDILAKHEVADISQATMTLRDMFSLLIEDELQNGPVHLDLRKVPASKWSRYPLSILSKLKFDFRSNLINVAPGAHFFMGGVRVDHTAQTDLPGLFACGEVVWGVHGANRRAGNALTECAVFGDLAGNQAAQFAQDSRRSSSQTSQPSTVLTNKPTGPLKAYKDILKDLQDVAWQHAGIRRSAETMTRGLKAVPTLQTRIEALKPTDLRQQLRMHDLQSAAFVLEGVLTASLGRKESRGAFIRGDFPDQGSKAWRCNSCLKYDSVKQSFNLSHFRVLS
jgi:aspartate oxidase